MKTLQPGILQEIPALARYLSFSLSISADIPEALRALNDYIDTENTVMGIGQSLILSLGKTIPGMRSLQAQSVAGIDIPSTPAALWCWLRGEDRGELFHRSRDIETLLAPDLVLQEVIDAHQFEHNHDLSGYEDGTENPQGAEALDAVMIQGQGNGLDGGSFVAVQQWLHDFDAFDAMTIAEQDDVIGRHIDDNEEFAESPASAHVKRAAQESFTPPAFMLRRSMPWSDNMNAGLMFVAFGRSFDAFEAILNRMLGKEDSIRDGLFNFTRPLSGAYYWCPPVKSGALNLSYLGI